MIKKALWALIAAAAIAAAASVTVVAAAFALYALLAESLGPAGAAASVAGLAAYSMAPWIGLAVGVVMAIVIASYRQNVHAYPSGGGDYEVASVNLGPRAGLTVASALLVDYVLTVAVSVSSGVQNAASAFTFIRGHEAPAWLARAGLPARLVTPTGTVVQVGDWPDESR